MDLDILFLGRLFPKEKETEIKAKMKTGMQDAANALQWNIIDGLEANNCGKLKILNYLPVDSYPKGYCDSKIEQFYFNHTTNSTESDLNVGCTNLSIIKHFVNVFPFKREIKKWANKKTDDKKVLILYTSATMFLTLAKYAKKLDNKIETCCIIADIPEFSTATDLHGIRNLSRNYAVKKANLLYKYIDKFVLLTRQMSEKLKLKSPYVVMEGIAPDENVIKDDTISDRFLGKKYACYSGTLNYKFGIKGLLEAFSLVEDKDLLLVICGFGEAETAIKQFTDERIVYLGKIDRKQVISLQQRATVLINPRQNIEEFTKYSFPSKTMEYLASGVPVIAYKLDGIPDEYDEYINYVPDNSPEALAQKIASVCALSPSERQAIGEKGKAFVLTHKHAKAQTKKILDFIGENR